MGQKNWPPVVVIVVKYNMKEEEIKKIKLVQEEKERKMLLQKIGF